ncbi:MAG: aromatic amino acid lyase, partial [Flavobacteriales bacterium]
MHQIDNTYLTLEKLHEIVHEKQAIELTQDATKRILDCRSFLDEQSDNSTPIYGVNTGFGSLCNESISQENLEELQVNLVISHACGFGEEVPSSIVKLMILLKVQSLSFGYSGVQLQTVNRLIDFYNEDILPVVYQQGSLGASGDLAPLAHLSLPLLGLGEVYYKGKKVKSEQVLKEMAWKPICLKSKEGLALLNG